MATKTETFESRVLLNAQQAKQTLALLEQQLERVRKEKKAAFAGGKDVAAFDRQIKQITASMKTLQTQELRVSETLNNLSTASYKELRATVNAINKELRSGAVERGSEQWRQMQRQLKAVKAEIAAINDESKLSQSIWQRTANWMNTNWGMVTQLVAGWSGLTMSIRSATQAYADMEEAMADTRKYTGQTDEQVRLMNEDFKKMDTRTSREQLNDLAGAAGRLGISATKDIEEFVDAADKIGVALGDDLGEGAVDKIGKLAQMFGEDNRLGLRGAMLATGSAVNDLAQSSSANAGYIVEFTNDLSGVAIQAGMTQTQLMGLASALDQNGQEAATSSTVFSQLITAMFQDPARFAKIAGVEVKAFADLLRNDANAALIQFLETMQAQGGFDRMAPMFADMKLDGTRAVGVLSSVASHLEQVKEAQELAAQSYAEGNSVINEFNVQNNTVQAQLDKAKNKFNDLTVELGQKLMPVARYAISTASMGIRALSAIVSFIDNNKIVLLTLIATITALNAKKLYNITLSKLQVAWNSRVATSIKGIGNAIKANPWGLAIAALTSFVALLAEAASRTRKNTEETGALANAHKRASEEFSTEAARIDSLNAVVHDNSAAYDVRKSALDRLKEIVPGYLADLDKEKGLINDNTDAITRYLLQLEKQIQLKAAQDELENEYRKKRTLENQRKKEEEQVHEDERVLTGAQWAASRQADRLGTRGAQSMRRNLDPAVQSAQSSLSQSRATLRDTNKKLDETNQNIADLRDEITAKSEEIAKEGLATVGKGIKTDKETNSGETTSAYTYVSEKQMEAERKAREKAEKERKESLKKDIEQQKTYTETNLLLLTASYAEGEIKLSEYIQKRSDIQRQGLDAQMNVLKIYGETESSEYKKLEAEKTEIASSTQARLRDISVAEIERRRRWAEASINARFYDSKDEIFANEDALNEALFINDMNYLKLKRDKYLASSDEYARLDMEIQQREEEHRLERQLTYEERLRSIKAEYLNTGNDERMRLELNGLDSLHKAGLMSEEQYQEAVLAIRNKYAKQAPAENGPGDKVRNAVDLARKQAGDKTTAGGDSLGAGVFNIMKDVEYMEAVNDRLNALYKEDLINWEECQQAKDMVNSEMWGKIIDDTGAALNVINSLLEAGSAYAQACSDYEVAKVTANYDKQIEAAGDNTAKREKLEKEKDEKIAAIKTKSNRKAMVIELAEATASTAMNALKAFGAVLQPAMPWTVPLAYAAAAAATAMGMLQVATIKKQHQAEQMGYYEGGFTGDGDYRREAGVVHAGEFVANHRAVRNPEILPVLQLIDRAQRNNTVAALTSADVSRVMNAGNAVVVAPVVNVTADTVQQEAVRRTLDTLSHTVGVLNKQLAEGITAVAAIDGKNGIARQLKHYNNLMNKK